MGEYLDCRNFPCSSAEEEAQLAERLESVIANDLKGNVLAMLGSFQRVLSDNRQRDLWDGIFEKFKILFMCGRNAVLDGPMIGVSLAIRDSDYFRDTARMFGRDRSAIAAVEWMATCWNATFANTGIWMGKTFEPVARETAETACDGDPLTMAAFSPDTTRIGRNFFRDPPDPNPLQNLGIPVLTDVWKLKSRPKDVSAAGFRGLLLADNLKKERNIHVFHDRRYFPLATGHFRGSGNERQAGVPAELPLAGARTGISHDPPGG